MRPTTEAFLRSSSPHGDRTKTRTLVPLQALNFQERRWVPALLLLVDIFTLQVSLALGFAIRGALAPWLPIRLDLAHWGYIAAMLLVVPMGLMAVGLYPGYGYGPVERLRRRVLVIGLFLGVAVIGHMTLLSFLANDFAMSRGVLLLTLCFAAVLSPVGEGQVRNRLIRRQMWGIPTVIIGAGHETAALIRALRRNPDLGLVPTAIFDDSPAQHGRDVEGVRVLGPIARAKQYAGRIHVALVSKPQIGRDRTTRWAARLPFHRVIIIPDLEGLATLGITARDLGGFAGLEVRRNLLRRRNLVIKRTADYVLGIPLFLASIPVLAVLGVWIKIVSPGPVFFTQERIGVGGGRFRIWKLRTMHLDAEARLSEYLDANPQARQQWDTNCKLTYDPRVIPVIGQLMRQTSLDELPQFWNVLRGQMSLVGPRPFPEYHLDYFGRHFRTLRQSVLPGITGLWQVMARSEGDHQVQEQLDTYYIRNWSLWLDLYILARTVSTVLSRRGAR